MEKILVMHLSKQIKTTCMARLHERKDYMIFSLLQFGWTNPLKWTQRSGIRTNCPFVSLLGTQGYVYSTFLKQYNPLRDSQRKGQMAKEQQQQQPPAMVDEDFDDLSLFVSGSGSSSLRSFNLNNTDSSSTLSGLQGEPESPEDLEDTLDTEAQQVCVVACMSFSELLFHHRDVILSYCSAWGDR